jgi:hypothetical protein
MSRTQESGANEAPKEPAVDEEFCGEFPVQRLLLGETELPKYNSDANRQFGPLSEALIARPMIATEIKCFMERMQSFRSPLISQLVSKKLLASNARQYMQVGMH